MVCSLLSEWCVATSFYQSSANHVYFYPLFNLRNLSYLINMGREYDFSAHISPLSIGQTLDSAYGVKPKKDGQSCPFDLSYAENRS